MDFMVIQSNIFPTAYKKKKKHFELVKFGSFACISKVLRDFPGGPVVEDPPADAGTQVQSLVQEDSTCLRATKPMCHNY